MDRRGIAIALGAGLVVLALLFRAGCADSDPPICVSMFNYRVPGEDWLAPAAGSATAVVVGMVLWLNGRRLRRR